MQRRCNSSAQMKSRKQIFALEHINDVALIKEDTGFSRNEQNWSRVGAPGERVKRDNFDYSAKSFRVEAYDVAHMSGQNMVGVMTVIQDGEPEKSEYKKFIIRTQKNSNDTGALEEILSRRFRHTEWGLPSLVVVDGSTAQVNVAKQVLNRYQFDIPIVGVVKDDRHKPKAILVTSK
jgi:excinuclease UvrABC nuclease subunit